MAKTIQDPTSDTIITANVVGKKIPFDNGIAWEVDGVKYRYGYALAKTNKGEFVDVLKAPEGFEILGDIKKVRRVTYSGDNKSVWYETVFQPHDGIIDNKLSAKWNKDHWIKCFGNDEHYYNDVEYVTYKNPKDKKLQKRKCYGISIQHKVNVVLWKTEAMKSTFSIPIEWVVERHLRQY